MKKLKLILPMIAAGSAALPLTMVTSCGNSLVVKGGITKIHTFPGDVGADPYQWQAFYNGKLINPLWEIVPISAKAKDIVFVDDGHVCWTSLIADEEPIKFKIRAKYLDFVGLSPIISIDCEMNTEDFKWKILSDTECEIEAYQPSSIIKKIAIPSKYVKDGKTYTLTKIGAKAFSGNNDITDVFIPSKVTTIGERAFSSCSKLKRVVTNNDSEITTIGVQAFSSDDMLSVFPFKQIKNLTTIQSSAFYGTGISEVFIGPNVQNIENNPFTNCLSLGEISVDPSNKYFVDKNANCVVNVASGKLIIGCPNTNFEILSKESDVKIIGRDAFGKYRGQMTHYIEIPNSVVEIETNAFQGSQIFSLTFHNTLKKMGTYVFDGVDITEIIFKGSKAEWIQLANNSDPRWYGNNVPQTEVQCDDGPTPVVPV
ncbi:MAG: leucine-rich repeat protein [Mycoplasmoidaceae bacterium]